jgi:hypothetical protein
MMSRVSHEEAYPGLIFRPSSRNWWAWLKGVPAECIHLDTEHPWMATLVPDTLYLRGKATSRREPLRPEVSLCRECLLGVIENELESYRGRVVAFEPDAETFTQYFFVGVPDFAAAGLAPEVAAAIEQRLDEKGASCAECPRTATWLWLSREQVASLDDTALIRAAPGDHFCSKHGVQKFCAALEGIAEANVFYMNVPYGDAGAYVWI